MCRKLVAQGVCVLALLAVASPGQADTVGFLAGLSTAQAKLSIHSSVKFPNDPVNQTGQEETFEQIYSVPTGYYDPISPNEYLFYDYLWAPTSFGNGSTEMKEFEYTIKVYYEVSWSLDPQTYARFDLISTLRPLVYFNETRFFSGSGFLGYFGYKDGRPIEYCDVFPTHCIQNSYLTGASFSNDGSSSWTLYPSSGSRLDHTDWITGVGSTTFWSEQVVLGVVAPGEGLHVNFDGYNTDTFWYFNLREFRYCDLTDTCNQTPPDVGGADLGDITPVAAVPLPGALGFGLISSLLLAMLRAGAGRGRRPQPTVA